MAQTPSEKREDRRTDVLKSVKRRRELMELGMPDDEAKKSLTNIINRAGPIGFDKTDIMNMDKQIVQDLQDVRREKALNENPLLEKRQVRAEGGETHIMPDGTEMAGATHGEYEEQMESLMDKETPMLPDEEMEEDYVDYVIEEILPSEDRNYLISALEKDDKLSIIFDKVVESAHEFSGSGPIEGLGTEKSDSIPARLSDGEFVFTAKATEEIGSDNLMSMMKDAEAGADERQELNLGGKPISEEEMAVDQYGKPIDSNIVDDEIRKGMLSTNPRLK
jgi:hypothetical protein